MLKNNILFVQPETDNLSFSLKPLTHGKYQKRCESEVGHLRDSEEKFCVQPEYFHFQHSEVKDKRVGWLNLEPVFGLSTLGYCRNMVVQHNGLHGRGSAPSVGIKGIILRS